MNTARRFPPPEDDRWIYGPGKGTCKKCGEERLVTEVIDFRGKQMFCQVCAHWWWALGRDKNWRD